MKFSEIEKIYTDIISRYIANGYQVNIGTARGSQGEIGKIDLNNEKEVVRIWIRSENKFDWEKLGRFYPRVTTIAVGRCEMSQANIDDYYGCNKYLWDEDFEISEKMSWREVGTNWYLTDEEAVKLMGKRKERTDRVLNKYQCEFSILPLEWNKIVLKMLRKKRGWGKIKIDDFYVCHYNADNHSGKDPGYYVRQNGMNGEVKL